MRNGRRFTKKSQSARSKEKRENYEVDRGMECEPWLEPVTVVEIKADEINPFPHFIRPAAP
jgi:ATP-dependent DNA ligase